MSPPFPRSCYRFRLAASEADVAAAQRLRFRAFRGAGAGRDADRFDSGAEHGLIEDAGSGAPVCTWRMSVGRETAAFASGYAAQFHDLAVLPRTGGALMELGRLCTDPLRQDPDILRHAFGALTQIVDQRRIGLIFGCATLPPPETRGFADLRACLAADHALRPRDLGQGGDATPGQTGFDRALATAALPPLLRSYLGLGARVGPSLAVDPDLGTCHVLVALETARVPPARAALLRRLVPAPLAAAAH